MIKVTYLYNGIEYQTESQVRAAIAKKERKCFGKPQTAEEWLDLNVEKKETVIADPEPVEPTAEQLAKQKLDDEKSERDDEIERLTVIVDNMVFRANNNGIASLHEVRDAMSEDETTKFILANYEVVELTKDQVNRAYKAAVEARTVLMVKPYAE